MYYNKCRLGEIYMKIYISADIEGITGVSSWDEAMGKSKKDFTIQMTKEVSAACYGATEAGVREILVKDAHGSARNIDLEGMPTTTRVLKGWSGGPLRMMEGLDETYDAVMLIGYHSGANMPGNPLAHTFSSGKFQWIKLNGAYISEFDLNAMIAHYFKVPVIMITGDQALCIDAEKKIPGIHTVATMKGMGDSLICEHPEKVIDLINTTAEKAILNKANYDMSLPEYFEFEISYKEAKDAYKAQFYPGVSLKEAKVISFETHDYMSFLNMFIFI